MKTGEVQLVDNQLRKFGSATRYHVVYLDVHGEIRPYAFTANELLDAYERAKKNREDVPARSRTSDSLWMLIPFAVVFFFSMIYEWLS